MKKILAIVLTMMLVPAVAMGMESMDSESMAEVTGQAGVKIAIDDVKMYQNIGGLWYTDTDGLSGDDAASVGISGLTANVLVEAISASHTAETVSSPDSTDGIAELSYSDMSSDVVNGLSDSIDPLTIDVTSSLDMIDGAGIQIQLPSIAIQQDSLSMSLSVHNDDSPLDDTTGTTTSFGDVHVGDTTMAITDGTVEIAPN